MRVTHLGIMLFEWQAYGPIPGLLTMHVHVDQPGKNEGQTAGRRPGHLAEHDGNDGLLEEVSQADFSVAALRQDILGSDTHHHRLDERSTIWVLVYCTQGYL